MGRDGQGKCKAQGKYASSSGKRTLDLDVNWSSFLEQFGNVLEASLRAGLPER